jgi:hypothetical protein
MQTFPARGASASEASPGDKAAATTGPTTEQVREFYMLDTHLGKRDKAMAAMGPTAEQVCRELECCSRNGSTAALHDAHKCKVTCVCAVFLLHACAGGRMCLFQLEQSSKACDAVPYAQRAQNAGRWVKQHHQDPAHSLYMSSPLDLVAAQPLIGGHTL